MTFLEHRIPPPLVGALVAAGMWGVSAWGPRLAFPPLLGYGAMSLLVAAGIAFDLSAVFAFRRSRTTVNPFAPQRSSALVTGGVYRITRNPMYVGMALLLLAWAVHLSALLPWVGIVVFVLYITRFQIQPEERALAGLFGAPYAAYVARVRRWL